MGISRMNLTDEQLAAAGEALRSFHGHLTPDTLNHSTQVSLAAMIAYMCYVFQMDPKMVCTMLTNNVKAISTNQELLQYVVDKVHNHVQTRRIISLPSARKLTAPELN